MLSKQPGLLYKNTFYNTNYKEFGRKWCQWTWLNQRDIKHPCKTKKRALRETSDYTTIEHRLAVNPYESRFGSNWKIRDNPALSPYCLITGLINHVILHSYKAMCSSKHNFGWYIVHDGLSLMASHGTKQLMSHQIIDSKTFIDC